MAIFAARLTSVIALLACVFPLSSATFVLSDTYAGHDFFDSWIWETMNDPTNGRVNYLSLHDALQANLTRGDSLFRRTIIPVLIFRSIH